MEAIYFDDGNYQASLSFLQRYADKINELACMLTDYRIETGINSMQLYIQGSDSIARAILQQQNDELKGMPEAVRKMAMVPVDLRNVDRLLRDLDYWRKEFTRFQQQAGRQQRQPIEFIGDDLTVNSDALRSHFTILGSKVVNDIINQANELKTAYNAFAEVCRKAGIHVIGGDTGILNYDNEKLLALNIAATRFI